MSRLAQMLRLAGDGAKKPVPKNGHRTGSTKDEIDLAVKEYSRTKSQDAFKAMLDLARDYQEEE